MPTYYSVEYAHTMAEIPNAFSLRPLRKEDMKEFYRETMAVRTGNINNSPMEDILDACTNPREKSAFLLLGHTGCGKSTELNRMSDDLWDLGYPVYTIQCQGELDLMNPSYEDLMILMGRALLQISGDLLFTPSEEVRKAIEDFWKEGELISFLESESTVEAEAGIKAETPEPVAVLLKAYLSISKTLRFNAGARKEYRQKIENRSGDWLSILNRFTAEITDHLKGKRPILIFEELDKLDPANAWNVFYNHVSTLSDLPFPVIYTFPIALFYDERFAILRNNFTVKRLPMIKQRTPDGKPYPAGTRTLREIVEKRAELSLFEGEALDLLIEKTGGSLRDLFRCINQCSRWASRAYRRGRREREQITMEDARSALDDLRSDLTAAFDERYYGFLADIYRGNHKQIRDTKKLLSMLEAGAVLEYNGQRWHDLHPLVAEFLENENLTAREYTPPQEEEEP